MKLSLKNFKQYRDFEIELPDTGLILLKGPSGIGKSTILHGIHYAKYGEMKKIKPWSGGGSPVVEFETEVPEYIKIVRTNTPNTLSVTTRLGDFKDDAAQAEIVRVFGMNHTESLAAEYIRQKLKGSLLSLGEADQLRFIQKLAFGEQDPEVTKKKINNMLTAAQAEASIIATDMSALEQRVSANKKKVSDALSAMVKPVCAVPEAEIDLIKNADKTAREAYYAETEALKQLEVAMANPLYTKASKFEDFKVIKSGEINSSISEMQEIQSAVKQCLQPLTPDQEKDLVNILNIAPAKTAHLAAKKEALDLTASAKAKYGFEGRLGEWAETTIASDTAVMESTRMALAQINATIAAIVSAPDFQSCPHCSGAITVKSGILHKHDGTSEKDRLPELSEKKRKLETDLAGLSGNIAEAKRLLDKANSLKAVLSSDPLPEVKTLEELDAKTSAARTALQESRERAANISKMNNNISFLQKKIDAATQSIKDEEASIEVAKSLPSLESLAAKKENIVQSIDKYRKLIQDLGAKMELVAAYEKEMATYNAVVAQIRGWQDMGADDEKLLSEKSAKHKAATERVGAVTRLKELSNFAAVRAVDGIINDINANAQVYLSKLFPDTGTSVRILNVSKNEKGEEKAKLSCEITHKGEDAGKDTGNLSGGEEDRIVLAFQLAIGDIYSTNMLMVDEGFSSTDTEVTMQLGLELLKEIADTKLVLVVQHGAPEGIFDEVRVLG